MTGGHTVSTNHDGQLLGRSHNNTALIIVLMSVIDPFASLCGYGGSDDVEAVQALAEEVGVEALINARDRHQGSCLHFASWYNRVKTARQLIAWFVFNTCYVYECIEWD